MKNKIKLTDATLPAIFFVALFFVVLQLWGGGFTGGDEYFTSLAHVKFNGYFNAAFEMAKAQGRFYQLLYYMLAQIPYSIDSLGWINAWRMMSSLLTVVGFWLFAVKCFGVRVGYLSVFIYLGVGVTWGSYNAFNALPFWFNIGVGFIFFSLYSYCVDLDSSRQNPSWKTLGLFTLGILAYELLLVYVFAFPLMNAYRNKSLRLRQIASSLLLPVTIIGIYLLLYISWRIYFPPTYEGTSTLSIKDFIAYLHATTIFSFSGLYFSFSLRDVFQYPFSFMALFNALIITTGIFVVLYGQIFSRVRDEKNQSTCKIFASIFLLFLIYSPNLILCLSPRYIQWVKSDDFYHGSYYSAYFYAILLSLVLSTCIDVLVRVGAFKFLAFIMVVFIVPLINSIYVTQAISQNYFNDSREFSGRWKNLPTLIEQLTSIPQTSIILCTNTLIYREDPYDYWSLYLSSKTGKNIKVMFSSHLDKCDKELIYDGNYQIKNDSVEKLK
jgi:hypothetical protein